MLKNICKIHLHCLLPVLLVLLAAPFLTGFDNNIARQVTVISDGQTKQLRTNADSPADILQEAGIVLDKGDGWQLQGVNRRVQDGSVIRVVRGKSVTITRNGTTEEYKSAKATVGEALKDLGISYSKKRVYPAVDTPVQDNMQIYVLSRGEELHFSEADVEIPVKYEEDHSLNFGLERVAKEGKPGKATVISKRIKNSDGSHSVQELARETLVEPEAQIIRKGMAMSVYTPDGYKRYTKKMTVEASAYTLGEGSGTGLTSIGLVPYEGIVAVDPRVIPYYTKMYIPGYGIAMAGDTGGAIIGNTIDLFYHDYHNAIRWGRRHVEIYILAD